MTHITLNLNAKLQPMHRGDLYEDPIDQFLNDENIGEVDGGGTLLSASREVANCDVEIDLQPGEEPLQKLLTFLEQLGVPKGSALKFADREDVPVGRLEGLALYLNGTELPAEVYEQCDVNMVVKELDEHLNGIGRMQSYWDGPQDTALYFYGESFAAMRERIQPFLNSYPLCQKCRVVQIA